VGYLAQDHREGIANGTNVADWLHSFDHTAGTRTSGLLGKMLFKGDEGKKTTDALSGRRSVRLFSRMLMLTRQRAGFDEPTPLDLE